ncbi:MAG: glycosyltransferase family 2 protein [Bryobacterales bacterium]
MKLSVVIPARNEAGSIQGTVEQFAGRLEAERIEHEILVVDDGSTDETLDILDELSRRLPQVRAIGNRGRHGFGRAVRRGLEVFTGDAVAIVMADASDSPEDWSSTTASSRKATTARLARASSRAVRSWTIRRTSC